MTASRLHQLSALGQSVWIDFLSRDMLRSGELARLHEEDAVVGVTSNPTIFQKAIAAGDAYDEQLRRELEDEPGLGRRWRPGRLRLARGRPDARLRDRGDDRRGGAPA